MFAADPDDFIVDEDGQPISKGRKKKHIVHTDKALQEAQDVFGVDFDFNDFDEDADSEYEDEAEEEVRTFLTDCLTDCVRQD